MKEQLKTISRFQLIFFVGNAQGYSFRPPKKSTNLQINSLLYKKLARNCLKQWSFRLQSFSNILARFVNGDYFAKGTVKCKIPANLMDKEVENIDDHGCLKLQDLVDAEMFFCSSYPFIHKTRLHCAERKGKVKLVW